MSIASSRLRLPAKRSRGALSNRVDPHGRKGQISALSRPDRPRRRKHMRFGPWLLAAISLTAAWPGSARAQDAVANFYRGKQIDLFIGTTAGGGYDTYARLIARHFSA